MPDPSNTDQKTPPSTDMAAPDVPRPRPIFDDSLDALRGLAALLVVLEHACGNGPGPDSRYHLSGIWQYPPPGHLSVLIFFLLSGYVIGVANPEPLLTARNRWGYLKKRWVRLYPLYVLALAATVAVAWLDHAPYPAADLGGWLLFGQGLVVSVPAYNQPLWSLGYEVLFYLFFLVVSARQWRAEAVVLAFLVLGLALSWGHARPIVLVSYAYGAVFWFLGLFLSSRPKSTQPLSYGTMLAFLLLLLSYQRLNLLSTLLYATHLNVSAQEAPVWFDRAIKFSDVSLLVCGLPLLCCFTNRTLPGQRWLERAAFALPGAYVALYSYLGKMHQPDFFNTIVLAVLFYGLAVASYALRRPLARWGEAVVRTLRPLGHISYGVYIIHFPLLLLVRQVPAFSGTAVTYGVRLLLYLALVFVVGWILECRLQPWVKQRLIG